MDCQLKLRINAVDIGDYRHIIHWSDMYMYYHTKNGYQLFSSNVMVIPFCLDTAMVQPTGTLNFSRLDKFEIVTPPSFPLSNVVTGGYLYGVGYNVLEIRDGTSQILYQD